MHGFGQRRTGRQHRREGCDNGIAGTRHVGKLLRPGSLMQHAALLVQTHAFLAARDQQRLGAKFASQCLRPRGHVIFVFPAPHHLAQFGAVGCNDARAMITGIVVALGIDQDDLFCGTSQLDHLRYVREPALAVIGQYQDVAICQQHLEIGQLVGQYFTGRRGLEIDA